MTTIDKVTCFPNEGTPQIINGTPSQGDIVRITTINGSVIYERYTPMPAPAAPAVVYKEVRKWEFATFASTAVGSNATFGGIVKACRDSVDNAVIGAYELFKSQSTLTYNEASALLTLLVAKSVVTAQQKTDILAAWPTI